MNFNFKTNIAKSILLALILMLVGCSAGDDLTTVLQSKESGKYTLDIDVVETDWDGETISATTRAGETMESLKASYVRSWDFTSLTSKEELLAMSGLTFTPNSPNPEFLKVDTDEKAVKLNGKVTISGLRATQTMTIVYKTTDAAARTLVPIPRNFDAKSGFSATTEKTTGTALVTTDGEGTITTTGPVYIYSISLSEAETEGFGLYCSGLNYTNTHVKWNSERGVWIIGNNDYNEYWPIRDERTLDVYAYAPYKSPAYTVAGGVLTFVAETYSSSGDLSGSNVDLLYASKVDYERSSDNPVALKFKHALAKLTFGTITNNTGETLYLNGFTVRGTLHKQGDLNLSTDAWTPDAGSDGEIKFPPDFIQIVSDPAKMAGDPDEGYIAKVLIPPLADKQTTIPPMPSRELLVIPDANGKITLNIKVNSSKETEQFSFPVILEKGKNKTYNITVQKNFEVVIE